MKAKTFFISAVAAILVCFGALILLVSAEDHFFLLSGIGEEETAVFDNQRYQLAGLIRHQDYSAVVMGTSLVANYRASWFTEGLGKKTLKVTFPDGWVSEFDAALELAFQTHPGLDTVYFGLDPNIMIRPDSQRTVELPASLYSVNPLDDVEFLLNADTLQYAVLSWIRRQSSEAATSLDDAYIWDGQIYFARETALAGYVRPEESGTVLPADAYLDVTDRNLDVICRWAEEHPDVRFVIWFPPYSILYWDKTAREGTTEAVITAVEHATRRLLEYDNVAVHCFLQDIGTITNLDNYGDHIHCSGAVTRQTAQFMMDGLWRLTRENYRSHLDGLRQFVAGYDYDAIFAS